MDYSAYCGNRNQFYGLEECRIVGGKGDGMKMINVRNAVGLNYKVLPERGMDIGQLCFKGYNCSFLSTTGYVRPAYFDDKDMGFLKSFTCGFLTTCGLRHVGPPEEYETEKLGLHGTISNIPAERVQFCEENGVLKVLGEIPDEQIFGDKLLLKRSIECDVLKNHIKIKDTIINTGDMVTPHMILYHFNMGYPLLDEGAQLYIGSEEVYARDEQAQKDLKTWNKILVPQKEFKEQCYYHRFEENGVAGLFNKKIGIGMLMRYNAEILPKFTQWKMMGYRDYVMGLEPGNCNPKGRKLQKESGELDFLKPGEVREYELELDFYDCYEEWKENHKG